VSAGDSMTGPLDGLRVLELAGLGAAPFAAMLLADMGAEVVRIDRPSRSSSRGDADARARVVNRGRRSIVLDVRDPLGLESALRLAERSDALLEGFRPGVMERLGLGPDVCLARNPRLVYGRMTGWGQTGPLSAAAGHDLGYVAVTGVLRDLCRDGGRPVTPPPLIGDTAGGGAFLALGVMAALWEAQRSGTGQVVDAAMIDGVAALSALTQGLRAQGRWSAEPGTNFGHGGAPHYDVYETSDGRYVALAALEDQFWQEFLELLGTEGARLPPREDPGNWPALRRDLAAIFKLRTRDEWAAHYAGSDACLTPVLEFPETLRHPQIVARGTYLELDGRVQPAPAPRFSRTAAALPSRPPVPGEHTEEILAELADASPTHPSEA
jgi:alpha-methylacyl-CoA racemase